MQLYGRWRIEVEGVDKNAQDPGAAAVHPASFDLQDSNHLKRDFVCF